jgi:hypothetical protein
VVGARKGLPSVCVVGVDSPRSLRWPTARHTHTHRHVESISVLLSSGHCRLHEGVHFPTNTLTHFPSHSNVHCDARTARHQPARGCPQVAVVVGGRRVSRRASRASRSRKRISRPGLGGLRSRLRLFSFHAQPPPPPPPPPPTVRHHAALGRRWLSNDARFSSFPHIHHRAHCQHTEG